MDQIMLEMIEVGRRLWQRGLVAANDGNISCRLPDGRILITASGVSKGFLQPEDLVILDMGGNLSSARNGRVASSESKMHLALYQAREDVCAIVHAHPPYATAFALAGIDFNENAPDEVALQLGAVPLLPHAPAGSEALAAGVGSGLLGKAALLAGHGAVTAGQDLWKALFAMEAVEQAAKINYLARTMRT